MAYTEAQKAAILNQLKKQPVYKIVERKKPSSGSRRRSSSSGGSSSGGSISSGEGSSGGSTQITSIPFGSSTSGRTGIYEPKNILDDIKTPKLDDKLIEDTIRVDTNQRMSQGSQTSKTENLAWTSSGSIKRTQQNQGKSSSGGVKLKDVEETKSSDLRSRGHRGQKEGLPKPGEELTTSEFTDELNIFRDTAIKQKEQKTKLYDFGQGLIDFEWSKPVEIEGEIYKGGKVNWTVNEFYRQFLYGGDSKIPGLDTPDEYNKTLSAKDYDIYLANMGKYYQSESQKIDDVKLTNIVSKLDAEITRVSDWHPDTKVRKIKQKDGTYKYEVDFPFQGADVYYSTSKVIEKRAYKNPWSLEAIGTRFALAMTPENFAGIPGTIETLLGNKDKAREIEVSAVAGTRNVKDPLSAVGWYLSSAPGVVGLTAMTAGSSSVAAPTVGRLSAAYPTAFAVGSKVGGTAIKIGVATYGTYEFTKNVSEGEIGRAFGGAARLGLTYYGMSKASEAGMMVRDPKTGLPKFKVGAYKGHNQYINRMFDKDAKQVISLLKQGKSADHLMTAWKAGASKEFAGMNFKIQSNMALTNLRVNQPEPTFTNIRNLFGKQKVINFFKEHSIFRSQKIIGGAGSNKPITGDYDVQYMPYGKAEAEYMLNKIGYNLADVSDPHYLQKVDTMATILGGKVEPSYLYPSGRTGIRWTEQFVRLSDSSLNLAHIGRVKDISESVRMSQQLFPSGFPKSFGFTMADYSKTATFLSKNPVVMSRFSSSLYYSPSSSDAIKDLKVDFYKKTMGWKFSKNLTKLNLGTKPISTASVSYSYLPPTPTWTPSSILSPLQMSAALNPSTTMNPMNFVRMYRTSPRFATTSTSFTLPTRRSPIVSTSKSLSNIFSKSFSSSSRSFSRSLSSSVSMPSISISGLSSSSSTSTSSSFSSSLSPSSSYSISASSSSSSSSKSSSSYSSSSSPFFGSGIWLPPRMMGGRGASSWEKYFKKLDYGFRKFDIPDIDKLAKRFKL